MTSKFQFKAWRNVLLSPTGLTALAVAGAVGIFILLKVLPASQAKPGEAPPGAGMAIPVTAGTAQQQSMPVWVDAQGTVTPRTYVSVMPRVAGLLQSVDFREGQLVKAGQLLATIDPRPFRIQMEQAQGQLLRDQAQLSGAESDLERYETLLKQDSISGQQVADQRATVAQLKGTVAADRAALDNAQLQLEWTRITAPTSGIVGLRQVDVGNIVGTNGAIGGGTGALSGATTAAPPIVTIAQLQPITVTFPVAQVQLPAILDRMHSAELPVQAWDQRRSAQLDTGKVIAVDNQVNVATGTVTIKAEFANARMNLFPNQFVNVRLLLDTLGTAVVVPSAAIAMGASGNYVYVIDASNKVAVRPVTPGASDRDYTAISSGLKAGERVVTDGLDRLKDGSTVQIVGQYGSDNAEPESPAEDKPDGAHRGPHKRDAIP
jgi:multidrug efflux system membrane fusion protein